MSDVLNWGHCAPSGWAKLQGAVRTGQSVTIPFLKNGPFGSEYFFLKLFLLIFWISMRSSSAIKGWSLSFHSHPQNRTIVLSETPSIPTSRWIRNHVSAGWISLLLLVVVVVESWNAQCCLYNLIYSHDISRWFFHVDRTHRAAGRFRGLCRCRQRSRRCWEDRGFPKWLWPGHFWCELSNDLQVKS